MFVRSGNTVVHVSIHVVAWGREVIVYSCAQSSRNQVVIG